MSGRTLFDFPFGEDGARAKYPLLKFAVERFRDLGSFRVAWVCSSEKAALKARRSVQETMSAIVCRKRSIFEELHTPPPVSKRLCFAGSTSLVQLSPSRVVTAAIDSPLAQPKAIFPDTDDQCLERALEACGNNLDPAIKSLNGLCLHDHDFVQFDARSDNKVTVAVANGDASLDGPSPEIPSDGPNWIELFVREMMNASDINDTRLCVSRILEVLEKSIMSHAEQVASANIRKAPLYGHFVEQGLRMIQSQGA